MIGVGVEDGKMDVRLLDPAPEEEGRPELRRQIRDAHELVVNARVEMGVQFRLHGDNAPETMEAWKQYGAALRLFSDLIGQV